MLLISILSPLQEEKFVYTVSLTILLLEKHGGLDRETRTGVLRFYMHLSELHLKEFLEMTQFFL